MIYLYGVSIYLRLTPTHQLAAGAACLCVCLDKDMLFNVF